MKAKMTTNLFSEKGAQKVMDKVLIQDSSSKFCTIASTTKPTVYRVGGKEVTGILKQ
jgi:hypothetical protein